MLLQEVYEHSGSQVQHTKAAYKSKSTEKFFFRLMNLCVRRLPEDGTLVPKHVGVGICREL